ncbi:OLC1v1038327C1 [Oldenlandia corymbosa var. corymbosa]|nr:OLC1v1038327C1 [Oldenlandia corymbosa var. corymbosa]
MGQALDIEIPPPRPKRKPSNPYPRKTINSSVVHMELKDGKPMHPTSFRHQAEQMIDLEKEPLPEKVGDQSIGNGEENPAGDKLPGKDLAIQGSPDTSSSVNKSSLPTSTALRKSYVSNEFISVLNEVANMDESIESHVTVEARANKQADELCTMQSSGKSSMDKGEDLANSHPLDEKLAQSKENQLGQSEKFEKYPKNDWQSVENQARHVSVQILDGSLGMAAPKVSHSESCQEPVFYKMVGVEPKTSTNPSTSGTSEQYVGAARFSINQPFAGYHPIFTPVQNQDNYQSVLHGPSTFSNLIVSALLQNPAAHAAASFAASFWPSLNVDAPAESPAGTPAGGYTTGQINGAPSIAAIAAATVAAATAWWASNGLLPLCAPFHLGFNYVPASTSTVPPGINQETADTSIDIRGENIDPALESQHEKSEFFKAQLQEQHSTSKSPSLPLSDRGEDKDLKSSNGATPKKTEQATAGTAEVQDANKAKGRKQIDRSSCGSNTPSSSEVETDPLEKHGESGKEECREGAVNLPSCDPSGRRSRSSSSTSESWKEVSEEGRLAFQALFSREVLPQSFSPPHGSNNKGMTDDGSKQNGDVEGDEETTQQRDIMIQEEVGSDTVGIRSLNMKEEGQLSMGKLKSRRTGFKPYKRCSVEAKESCRLVISAGGNEEEEKGTKRIRLDGEAFYPLNQPL